MNTTRYTRPFIVRTAIQISPIFVGHSILSLSSEKNWFEGRKNHLINLKWYWNCTYLAKAIIPLSHFFIELHSKVVIYLSWMDAKVLAIFGIYCCPLLANQFSTSIPVYCQSWIYCCKIERIEAPNTIQNISTISISYPQFHLPFQFHFLVSLIYSDKSIGSNAMIDMRMFNVCFIASADQIILLQIDKLCITILVTQVSLWTVGHRDR